MVMKSSPHVHTNLVDGVTCARDMVKAAIDKGFYSIGFSEHATQPFDFEYSLSQRGEAEYIEMVKELSREYADELIIALGIERDEFSTCDRSKYAYIIGSKHYFARNGFTDFFSVDSNEVTVKTNCDRFFNGDWYELCGRYFSDFADYVCSFKPDIIAHFDLVCKFNEKAGFFDETDERYLSAGYAALERMAKAAKLMEINTGAMARGYKTSPYPALPFLKRWRELGGEVILSTDCHNADFLDYGLDAARQLALDAGYEKARRLCSSDGRFEEYEL